MVASKIGIAYSCGYIKLKDVTAVSWTEGGLKGEKAVPVSMD
jgi:hypothetical protein